MGEQDRFDLRNLQALEQVNGRDDLLSIPPSIGLAENEAGRRPARTPSSVMNLLIISIFVPDEIVPIVEQTVGWPDLSFGNQEGRLILQMNPGDFKELARVVQALRDIKRKTWTSEIQYVMGNLQEYKTLLGRLLDDLKYCREMRYPRTAQPQPLNLPISNPNDPPQPNVNDLTDHANTLEVLLTELDPKDYAVILLDRFDQHIFTVHQLIEFLT